MSKDLNLEKELIIEEIINEQQAKDKFDKLINDNEFTVVDYCLLGAGIGIGYLVGQTIYNMVTSK